MLLPPRKLDLYTFSLAGAWVVSAEEVTIGGSRRPQRRQNSPNTANAANAENAENTASAENAGLGMGMGMGLGMSRWGWGKRTGTESVSEDDGENGGDKEEEGEGEEKYAGVKGLAKKIWMGDERTGWQKRRLERERAALEGGGSYGDIIMRQVREVFPGFGGKGGGEGEGDEGGGG